MPIPVIAIVGRPNVGKSTLFNRLAGRRIAIVSDIPGTTRDRVSIDAEWQGRRYIVMDTGGIEDKPSTSTDGTPVELWAHVRDQTKRAIEQSDGVIFVVDATTGQMPQDRDAAELVRRSGKPAVLAVNKSDSPGRALAVSEFYTLGAGEPMPISAYHGMGAHDVLAALFAKLPSQEDEPEDPHIPRVAIVGRPNVGKSALFNALTGEERAIVSPLAGTTRDSIDTRVRFGDREMLFIDTAGLRRRGKISEDLEKFSVLRSLQSIERCHVAVVVLDATEFVAEQDTHVGGFVDEASRGVVIVVNKWDLGRKAGIPEDGALDLIHDRFKFFPTAPILFTSALTGRGVEKIPAAVLQVYDEFTREFSQPELATVLADAVSRRPPPQKGLRKFKISEISQTRHAPPTLTLRTNAPQLIHFSYRRYLENQFREHFGFTGSPINLEFVATGK